MAKKNIPVVVDTRTHEQKVADAQKYLRESLERAVKNSRLESAMASWAKGIENSSIGYAIQWYGIEVLIGEAMEQHCARLAAWVKESFEMVPDAKEITFADRVNRISEKVFAYRERLVEDLSNNSWLIEWDKSTSAFHNAGDKAVSRALQIAAGVCKEILYSIKTWRNEV